MNNYEFCADFALRTAARSDFKVLDYGCGAGEVVGIMRRNELDAYVCELFYQGGDLSEQVPADIQDRIFAMHGDRIPFPDESFDLVISNQVLEHVPDLDVVLAEMRRVLKPGGICLSVFPHREVWREGHCNIPLLHRFARGSKPRIYYAATLRSLGLGYFKKDMTSMQWSRNFCDCWTGGVTTVRGGRSNKPSHGTCHVRVTLRRTGLSVARQCSDLRPPGFERR
jgi:SAM-dependent methyltransferase